MRANATTTRNFLETETCVFCKHATGPSSAGIGPGTEENGGREDLDKPGADIQGPSERNPVMKQEVDDITGFELRPGVTRLNGCAVHVWYFKKFAPGTDAPTRRNA